MCRFEKDLQINQQQKYFLHQIFLMQCSLTWPYYKKVIRLGLSVVPSISWVSRKHVLYFCINDKQPIVCSWCSTCTGMSDCKHILYMPYHHACISWVSLITELVVVNWDASNNCDPTRIHSLGHKLRKKDATFYWQKLTNLSRLHVFGSATDGMESVFTKMSEMRGNIYGQPMILPIDETFWHCCCWCSRGQPTCCCSTSSN